MNVSYIGQIIEIKNIEKADRLELATVVCGKGGRWHGVVPINDFQVGDICNVFLQDAIIPQDLGLDFMKKSHWRVRMARFRGAPSECLITKPFIAGEVGTPIDNELGVIKYEKPIPANLAGDIKGGFPSFIPKTDEPNYQTVSHIAEFLLQEPVYISIKVDGSSGTVYNYNGFGVCSRNIELKEKEENAFWQMVEKYDLRNKIPEGYAIQFEVYGEGIQKNPLGISGIDMQVFNLYNIEEHKYEDAQTLKDFCEKNMLPMVKAILWNEYLESIDDEYLQKLAEGKYENGKDREGIVIRSMNENNIFGDRSSMKVINLLYKD